MAYGNVYIFNLCAEEMFISNLNGMGPLGSVASPLRSTNPPYVPQQLIASRTNLTLQQLNSPLFVIGENQLTINFAGESRLCRVSIPSPPNPPLQADLWLYIAYRQAFLFDTAGNLLESISLD
ncbi:MAG TPA: hypothetical protein VGO50_00490 [Pyrinomonadaceae bacterium]|jgi:hypothetical protein|nr:hypothetical protein [Pyrinomonadaceae bacterium]